MHMLSQGPRMWLGSSWCPQAGYCSADTAANRCKLESEGSFIGKAGQIRRSFSYLMRFYRLFPRSYDSSGVSGEQTPSFSVSSLFKDTFNLPLKIFPNS